MNDATRRPRRTAIISSTCADLPDHRAAVRDACLAAGFFPEMMESLSARDAHAVTVSRELVERADVYIGIYAHRYGHVPEGWDKSITHLEYEWAEARGGEIKILVFLMDAEHPIGEGMVECSEVAQRALAGLKQRVCKGRVYKSFRSVQELRGQVESSLKDLRFRELPTSHLHLEQETPAYPMPATVVARDEDIATVTGAVSAPRQPRRILLLGPPGVGKTVVGLSVLNAEVVKRQYGEFIYMAHLQAAQDCAGVVDRLIAAVKIEPVGNRLGALCEWIRGTSACLLMLDSLEVAWGEDTVEVSSLLQALGKLTQLDLLVTVQGNEHPLDSSGWTKVHRIEPLSAELSKVLFYSYVSPPPWSTDEQDCFEQLLRDMSGLPLAIRVLASAANGTSPRVLLDEWRAMGMSALGPNGASYEGLLKLSERVKRISADARRLLTIIAWLPDGMSKWLRDDLKLDFDAVNELTKRSFVQLDSANRHVMLPPIRKAVLSTYPIRLEDRRLLCGVFCRFALEYGPRVGWEDCEDAARLLQPEISNLVQVLRDGLMQEAPDDLAQVIKAASALTTFCRLTGRGSPPLDEAANVALRMQVADLYVTCLRNKADLLLYRGDAAAAELTFWRACESAKVLDRPYNLARCLERLGDIERDRGDYEAAHDHYQKADDSFERCEDLFGRANCIERLGMLQSARENTTEAENYFQKARALYAKARRVGDRFVRDVGGVARCDLACAEIALASGRWDLARRHATAAQNAFERVADAASAGRCLMVLGQLAVAQEDDLAESFFLKAKEMFESVGQIKLVRAAEQALRALTLGRPLVKTQGARGLNQQRRPSGIRLISDVPLVLENLEELEQRLRVARVGLFFDYDGTLTPIVNDPAAALLDPQVRQQLEQLGRNVPIAIVSGRDLNTLTHFVQLPGLYYAGSHGFELQGPDYIDRPNESEIKPIIEKTYDALARSLARFTGTRLEQKPYSVAVHWREAREEELPEIFASIGRVRAAHPRLRRRDGKKVTELQIDIDRNKGKAVELLLEAQRSRSQITLPIYVGDDLTDEDAFEAVQRAGGLGLVVHGETDRTTRADFALRDVQEVCGFLDLFNSAVADGVRDPR